MIVVGIGVPLGFVNGAIFMFWWTVEAVEPEVRRPAAIHHVVPSSGGNYDGEPVGYRVSLPIQNDGSLPPPRSEETGQVRVLLLRFPHRA